MRIAYSPCCELVSVLGKGASAVVSLGEQRDEQGDVLHMFAVKSASLSVNSSKMLMREKEILDHLNDEGCPEIVFCFGEELVIKNAWFSDYTYNVYLEYACRGSLSDLLIFNVRLPERTIRSYTASMLRGLAHIHARGYVHCDIKPDNILVWNDSQVKIADFGLAKKAGDEHRGGAVRGTPMYLPPEAVEERRMYEPPLDIWSLGCTVVEMYVGEPAVEFDDRWEFDEFLGLICSGQAAPRIPSFLPDVAKDFLRNCFVRDPNYRWTAEMLLRHDFVTGRRRTGGGNVFFSC